MSERYTFAGDVDSFEKFALTNEEEGILKRLGMTPEDLRKLLGADPFAEGSYALLFEFLGNESDLIIKAWKNRGQDSERGANENAALRLLRIRDFKHAPQVKGYLKPSTILFEKKIEGEPVEQFDNDQIERLALALSELHSIELNAYGKPFTKRTKGTRMDFLLDGIETLQKNVEPFADQTEAVDMIHRSLDKVKTMTSVYTDAFSGTNFTLIHFDLNKNNILYSKKDGSPILVDWEQASAGDNAMDIAKLFLKSDFNADQKRNFLNVYENGRLDQDPYFKERLNIYEPFVLINSLIWRLRVLRDMPQQTLSKNEIQFYDRVRSNFKKEIDALKNFISE